MSLIPRTSRIMFTAILLFPIILLIPSHSGNVVRGNVNSGAQPAQYYPSPTEITTLVSSSACDPMQYYLVSTTPQIHILSFDLNKQLFRPGETVGFTGSIMIDDTNVYANCYGQSYSNQNQLPASQANVQVTILGKVLQLTPSTSGTFSGNTVLPLTISGGSYTATATATFQGVSDTRQMSFTVEAYTPTLSIKYPTNELQAYPGESIVLDGEGWIPNLPVLVEVDDNFNVSTDVSGNFSLPIQIPLDNPPAAGNHTITAKQANLIESTTLLVKYRTLVLSLSPLSPIIQGQNLTLSGNVTTLENHEAVPGANVTFMLMGRSYAAQTSANGTFETEVSIGASTSPGTYAIYANATRRGFTASSLVKEAVKILPASNVALVASVVVVGSVAGVATTQTLRKVSKPKVIGTGHASSGTIGPGASGPQSSIGPGTPQVQPEIGAGQPPQIVGPGQAAKGGAKLGEIRTGLMPSLGTSEFCIHCGVQIRRGSAYCPECGLRLK